MANFACGESAGKGLCSLRISRRSCLFVARSEYLFYGSSGFDLVFRMQMACKRQVAVPDLVGTVVSGGSLFFNSKIGQSPLMAWVRSNTGALDQSPRLPLFRNRKNGPLVHGPILRRRPGAILLCAVVLVCLNSG